MKATFAILLVVAAASATENPPLALVPTAHVDGQGIFLDQLVARTDGQPLPHVRLAESPVFGNAMTFTREQVDQLIRRNAATVQTTNFTGSASVQISRKSRMLGEAEVTQQLVAALQKDYIGEQGELELTLTRAFDPVLIPAEPFEMKMLNMPTSGLTSSLILRFELRNEHEVFGSWSVMVRARVLKEILVTTRALRRGELLRDDDLRFEKRDLFRLRNAVAELPASPTGYEIMESLQPGVPLTGRSVRFRPMVFRGQVADAVVARGPLNIATRVEVLEDGLPGEIIRVRNLISRREFRGKVKDEQTILVTL